MNTRQATGIDLTLDYENPSEEAIPKKAPDLLDEVTRLTERSLTITGIVVGTFAAMDQAFGPLVDFPMNPEGRPLAARSTVELTEDHLGRKVALMFEKGDGTKPIVIGLMHEFQGGMPVSKDGEIQEITAEKELTLRCGKASITLREDGSIETRGEDILSKARKNHKIKGGMVYLN